MRFHALALVALCLAGTSASAEVRCRWREPARTYPVGMVWTCEAIRWTDGDTLTAACQGYAEVVRVRLRGVDTVERGDPRWAASRAELRRQTEGLRLAVLPRHDSGTRVVADVLAGGVNVGAAMDSDGWSKEVCARR